MITEYKEGEVLGVEPTGMLIFWNADTKEPYTSGELLQDCDTTMLTSAEKERLGIL